MPSVSSIRVDEVLGKLAGAEHNDAHARIEVAAERRPRIRMSIIGMMKTKKMLLRSRTRRRSWVMAMVRIFIGSPTS